MKKLFLDTNILADLVMSRIDWLAEAKALFTLAADGSLALYATPNSIATLAYILGKKNEAYAVKTALRSLCSRMTIIPITAQHIDLAMEQENGFSDPEDAMQYFAALSADCEVIITRDQHDFRNATLPAMDAKAFLAQST